MPTLNPAEAKYVLTILDEPQEEPILLTQKDFETIIRLGISVANESEIETNPIHEPTSTFATLELINKKEEYIFEDNVLPAEKCQENFEKGFKKILHDAVFPHRNSEQ
jgi:hypothetical protein